MTAQGALSSLEEGLRAGLHELGYIDGKEHRHRVAPIPGTDKELRHLARKSAGQRLEGELPSSRSAHPLPAPHYSPTTTVPIVFLAGDPVGTGLAASLARPGGQSTGVSMLMPREMVSKRVQLLQQVVPGTRRIVFLMNSSNPLNVRMLEEAQRAARTR